MCMLTFANSISRLGAAHHEYIPKISAVCLSQKIKSITSNASRKSPLDLIEPMICNMYNDVFVQFRRPRRRLFLPFAGGFVESLDAGCVESDWLISGCLSSDTGESIIDGPDLSSFSSSPNMADMSCSFAMSSTLYMWCFWEK